MLQIQTGLTTIFLVGTLVVSALIAFILLYIIIYQQKVNRFHKTLQKNELDKQADVYKALLSGQENERKRIAEELHDGIGAKLAALKMNLEYLYHNKLLDNELLRKNLNWLNETIDEVRDISHNLHPSAISNKGVRKAINELIDTLNKKGDTHFELFWNVDDLFYWQSDMESLVYRITSELLHNTYKHAKATQVIVQVTLDEKNIILIVEDNGLGIKQLNITEGLGLRNIQSRLNTIGGVMTIDSAGNIGTTIIIELPFNNHEN